MSLFKIVLYIHDDHPPGEPALDVREPDLTAAFRGFDPSPREVQVVGGIGWVTYKIRADHREDVDGQMNQVVTSLIPRLAVYRLLVLSWQITNLGQDSRV